MTGALLEKRSQTNGPGSHAASQAARQQVREWEGNTTGHPRNWRSQHWRSLVVGGCQSGWVSATGQGAPDPPARLPADGGSLKRTLSHRVGVWHPSRLGPSYKAHSIVDPQIKLPTPILAPNKRIFRAPSLAVLFRGTRKTLGWMCKCQLEVHHPFSLISRGLVF